MISLVQQVKQLKEKLDWGFSTAPQANLNDRRITYTRGKVVGGSSSVNGMIYLRGNKENYNDWAARGCDGWSFEDVLPFYKKLEDHQDGETEYHGAGGPIRREPAPGGSAQPGLRRVHEGRVRGLRRSDSRRLQRGESELREHHADVVPQRRSQRNG